MNNRTRTKQVFRPTITDIQMLGVVEILQYHKSVHGLNPEVLQVLAKFERDLVSINYGTKTPAYIATGIREEKKVTVENLEAMDTEQSVSTVQLPTASSRTTVQSPTLVSLAEADLEAELERLNNKMLADLAAEGNQNVVLEERRATPRQEESVSADNELFLSL